MGVLTALSPRLPSCSFRLSAEAQVTRLERLCKWTAYSKYEHIDQSIPQAYVVVDTTGSIHICPNGEILQISKLVGNRRIEMGKWQAHSSRDRVYEPICQPVPQAEQLAGCAPPANPRRSHSRAGTKGRPRIVTST